MIFSPDQGGQVEALRGGQLNYVAGLSAQLADTVKSDPQTKIITITSNMHWVIHMRSDKGHVAADNRVREALKLATDHQAIVDAVRPGLASIGNGFTPVGPAFPDYYLDKQPKVDIARAKRLLAEAGYPNGLKITLATQNQLDVVPIATVWKEQMAKIGVQVDIQVVPSDQYYGTGDQSWLVADFGITDWGARATPVTYFKFAYRSDAQWNESHWSDSQFDEITTKVDKEMDKTKRVALYKQAQEILIDRGPVIVPFFVKAVAGLSTDLQGVVLPSDWARTRFTAAWFSR
jgi:peptide/nickel transport system substrate-binding protein